MSKWGFAFKVFKVALNVGAQNGAKVKGISVEKVAAIETAIEEVVNDAKAAKKAKPPKPALVPSSPGD